MKTPMTMFSLLSGILTAEVFEDDGYDVTGKEVCRLVVVCRGWAAILSRRIPRYLEYCGWCQSKSAVSSIQLLHRISYGTTKPCLRGCTRPFASIVL